MFTINQNDSCLSLGAEKAVPAAVVINAIARALGLKPNIDVIIGDEHINNPSIYNNARLYVDVIPKPAGFLTYCLICKTDLHEEIIDPESFLKSISKELDSRIFVDKTENIGFLISPEGVISERTFITKDIENNECVFVN